MPVIVQNLIAVVLLTLLRRGGWVSYEMLDPKSARTTAPLAMFFVVMLLTVRACDDLTINEAC